MTRYGQPNNKESQQLNNTTNKQHNSNTRESQQIDLLSRHKKAKTLTAQSVKNITLLKTLNYSRLQACITINNNNSRKMDHTITQE
jgi:hypothetical protein